MLKESQHIKTIVQAFQIIECISKNKAMGISELSSVLNMPKATVFRTIKTLEHMNVIQQTEQAEYTLGYRMLVYAKHVNQNNLLVSLAKPFMKRLVDQFGETVNLGQPYQEEVLFIHSEVGDYYSLQPQLALMSPLYCSGMGKLFLSEWSDDDLKKYFIDLNKRTIHTITSLEDYNQVKVAIKNNGVAYDHEEYEYGLTCIAVPIQDSNNKIRAAMSISGPTSRLRYKGYEKIQHGLQEEAKKLSEQLNEVYYWDLNMKYLEG